MNDLDIDLARNTLWVDMSVCVKCRSAQSFGRLYTEHIDCDKQKDKHIAFYYIDYSHIGLFCVLETR